jgi:hypothetical protein
VEVILGALVLAACAGALTLGTTKRVQTALEDGCPQCGSMWAAEPSEQSLWVVGYTAGPPCSTCGTMAFWVGREPMYPHD